MQHNILDKKNISYQPAGQFEETRFEKIHNVIFDDSDEASINIAQEIAQLIKEKELKKERCIRVSYRIFTY